MAHDVSVPIKYLMASIIDSRQFVALVVYTLTVYWLALRLWAVHIFDFTTLYQYTHPDQRNCDQSNTDTVR